MALDLSCARQGARDPWRRRGSAEAACGRHLARSCDRRGRVGGGRGVSKPKLWNCSACAVEGHQEPALVWHHARHRLAAVRVAGVARVASGGVDVKSRAVRSRRG